MRSGKGTIYKSRGDQPATVSQSHRHRLQWIIKCMKCWSFVHNIAVLRINAPFPIPSSNLIGTRCSEGTIFVRVIYVFIFTKSCLKYSDEKKRQEIHWSTLNAHWAHRMAILYFVAFIHGLSSNNGVLGNGCAIHCINTFPYYRSTFNRRALLSWSCWSSGFIYVSVLDLYLSEMIQQIPRAIRKKNKENDN